MAKYDAAGRARRDAAGSGPAEATPAPGCGASRGALGSRPCLRPSKGRPLPFGAPAVSDRHGCGRFAP